MAGVTIARLGAVRNWLGPKVLPYVYINHDGGHPLRFIHFKHLWAIGPTDPINSIYTVLVEALETKKLIAPDEI